MSNLALKERSGHDVYRCGYLGGMSPKNEVNFCFLMTERNDISKTMKILTESTQFRAACTIV